MVSKCGNEAADVTTVSADTFFCHRPAAIHHGGDAAAGRASAGGQPRARPAPGVSAAQLLLTVLVSIHIDSGVDSACPVAGL